jgi:hypothetical protein
MFITAGFLWHMIAGFVVSGLAAAYLEWRLSGGGET